LTEIHPSAEKAAEAAECAGEQGKYWEMHDAIFANETALGVDMFKTYAVNLGLNTTSFNECLDNGAMAAEVKADQAEGLRVGIDGVPTFFINGRKLKGAQPFEAFKAIIDEELAKVK
jgi:protein-disulfide isomerase